MITLTKGNIFDADVEALVNPVNCVGVMGKGLALQFKERYPDNYHHYKNLCRLGCMQPGRMTPGYGNEKLILNIATKDHWRDKSQLCYISLGLTYLISAVDIFNLKSIAIPPLGCGLGGLDWKDVKPIIIEKMETRPNVNTVIYEP